MSLDRLETQLQNLPPAIFNARRFLLWKSVVVSEDKKPRKIPFYTNSRARQGDLDTPEDLRQLTSLKEALAAAIRGSYTGVGFALVDGDDIGAFDLDDCLDLDGELIMEHPGARMAIEMEIAGAYIEVSPSGRGLRIFGSSTITEAYSKNGLEYWGAGRYVTVTGSVWSSPKGWVDIEKWRAPLRARSTPKPVNEDDAPLITPRVIEELRSALESMDSDERTLWVRMGMALKDIGPKGKELWLQWSKKSKKFDAADAEDKWEGFRPLQTNYKAVFAEAQSEWGWVNPRKKNAPKPEDPDADPGDIENLDDPNDPVTGLLESVVDLGDNVLHPTEFVLDGFLPTGVSLVAGAWGSGKSTNLIPLFASVAHLTPEGWGFYPQLRRHVIWITEAPDQARDTLYSLAKEEFSAPWSEIKKWFHLLSAKRKDPKQLARILAVAVKQLTYIQDYGAFPVRPVIVLDTTSANLDLENESDNSEVGAAMSALKERLPGIPIVLVGHTPKAVLKSDVSDMTFRGAGAWEADAVATYYLVHDVETNYRFLALRKSRFSPSYTEVSFGQEGGRELVDTPWGNPQSKGYLHGVPCMSNGDERKAAQKAAREEKVEEGRTLLRTERQKGILSLVQTGEEGGRLVTKGTLREAIGGKTELLIEALSRLIEQGEVASWEIPESFLVALREKGVVPSKGAPPSILLSGETNLQEFLGAVLSGASKGK